MHLQHRQIARERFGGEHVFDAAKFGIAALAQIKVHRVLAFFTAALPGDHAQINAAHARWQYFGIPANCHHAIDGISSRGHAVVERLGEKTRFIRRHDLGAGAIEIYRIDDGGAETLHVGDRLVGDADAVAVGDGCFDHELADYAQTFTRKRFSAGVISVRHGFLAMRRRRHMIARVGARDYFEHCRGVLHGKCHVAAGSLVQ
jgi:hypothetical protein